LKDITPGVFPGLSTFVGINRSASRLAEPRALADMLLYRLNRLRAVGGGMVLRYCEGRFGVTRREWVLMALLAAHGPVTSSQLAQHAALDKSATSKAVMTLLRKGLISRAAVRGDRRFGMLALTPGGEDLYRRIFPVVAGVNRELMEPLSPAEVDLLDDLLARMETRAADMALAAGELPRANRRAGGTRSGTGARTPE
jgi:DNA-binding MarR family transcriptional regulator